jgi:ABC-type multidrug transport system fused ATPase/permease subunit
MNATLPRAHFLWRGRGLPPAAAAAAQIIGRLFNNLYYPYAPDSARGHLREYSLALAAAFAAACALEALFSTLVFVAGERMASRTRRRLFQSLLRQETAFFDARKCVGGREEGRERGCEGGREGGREGETEGGRDGDRRETEMETETEEGGKRER